MRYRETAKLIVTVCGLDSDGYSVPAKEIHREVFVDVQAVRRSEYYEAMRTGLNLAVTFLMRACDYVEEKRVDYDGKRYKVERTYIKDGEMIELICSEWKGGTA